MILKGNQRAGGTQLAAHLLKTEENEHVEIHDLRGFVSDNLRDALNEAYAVSRGTRCKQYLFSLSLNPPPGENASIESFEAAIEQVEQRLGLDDQPRAIVFHEKEGRRHAHAVWSRIDVESMTAVNLAHTKLKLREIAKELYLEHEWKMPIGFVDSSKRDPLNFSRAEWQQAKRTGQDPKALKAMIQECWATSDNKDAFAQALEQRGLYLARGDRRGYVAVDFRGEVFSIARYANKNTKTIAAKLGDLEKLPSVQRTKAQLAARMTNVLKDYIAEVDAAHSARSASLAFRRNEMAQRHRNERNRLLEMQAARWTEESKTRAERLNKGIRGFWDRITGQRSKTLLKNEYDAWQTLKRDQAQKNDLIKAQLDERRGLQAHIQKERQDFVKDVARLHRDVSEYMKMERENKRGLTEEFAQLEPNRQQKRQSFDFDPEI